MKKLVLALAFFWSFLNALEIPQISKYDRKITYAVFNAHQVFRIASANGYVSVVEFGKDERIINTATGFSEGWELTDKGNLLFIKPKAYTTKYIHSENPEEGNAISEIIIDPNPAQWKTNLIVTTNVNMYVFELILNAKEKVYKLSFTYPQKELDKESILNTHIKKDGNYDVLVIHKTLPKILLRSGDKVVGIFNRGYAKNPLSATPQTSNDSEVERVLLDEKSKKKEQITEVLKQVGESNE